MVWKCCVPKCGSRPQIPLHRFPSNHCRAEVWLNAIGKTDLIGASKEILAKLRICTEHFSEEMILPYGCRRRLCDNAVPILNLISFDNKDHSNIYDNVSQTIEVVESVSDESNLVPEPINMSEKDEKLVEPKRRSYNKLRRKLRTQRKILNKKKHIIYKQRHKINVLRKKNKWETIMKDTSKAQKLFMEIITTNVKFTPQNDRTNNFMPKQQLTACMMCHIDKEEEVKYDYYYEGKRKALALTLYKTMGKHAYTRLRNIFHDIPSTQMLQLILQKTPITAGLNHFILKHLQNIAPNMSVKDKVCILMWDEVAIQPKVTYDTHKDIICGLEDWGNNRTVKIADHVLVFMLRGLKSGWKVPISYNFCNKQTSTAQLVRCIKEHIHNINVLGFHIVATVCDHRSSNVSAIKELLSHTERKRNSQQRAQNKTFKVGNNVIVPLYDPPRLIKDIRNNLLSKDLAMKCVGDVPEEIASWDTIKTAWIMDRELNQIRPQLKKITMNHIIEDKIKKMDIKYATQVLSGTMASMLETLTRFKCVVPYNEEELQIEEEDGLPTAEAVNFFNDLFDSVNGNDEECTDENKLRRPVSENSEHHTFWIRAKRILRDMRYINKSTHDIIRRTPSLTNWLFTVDNFQKLWNILNSELDFQKLITRYCNQDPLEKFLGQIKSHAVCYTNPTPRQFEDSYITLLMSNMKSIYIVNGNCETSDDSFMLLSLEQHLPDHVSNVEVLGVARKGNCCDSEFLSDHPVADVNVVDAPFSEHYNDIKESILKEVNNCLECSSSLTNSKFPVCARQIIYTINKLLKTRSHRRNISHVILQFFNNWNADMSWHQCIKHVNMFNVMLRIIVIRTIVWWCSEKNKMLQDENVEILKDDVTKDVLEIKRTCALLRSNKCKRKRLLSAYQHAVHQRMNK